MGSSESTRVINAALLGNVLVALTKFAAAAITGSSAMASEAVHSLVDTGNELLLLYGLRRAAKPADADHPFGHGRELYFWSFIVALAIFAVGAGASIFEDRPGRQRTRSKPRANNRVRTLPRSKSACGTTQTTSVGSICLLVGFLSLDLAQRS